MNDERSHQGKIGCRIKPSTLCYLEFLYLLREPPAHRDYGPGVNSERVRSTRCAARTDATENLRT